MLSFTSTPYYVAPVRLTTTIAPALAIAFAANPSWAQTSMQTALPTITVTAQRTATDNALLPGVSLFELPVSLNSLSAEQLRAQGVNSLSNVIKYDASAGDAYNTLGYIESMTLRGFLLDNRFNYRRDGLPVSNHVPMALDNKQRVELLKGTSGSLAGVSAPGGLVNWVVKQPTAVAFSQADVELSERGSILVSADVGGRSVQDKLGYRVNAATSQRRPFADNAPGNKQFLSGYFDWRFSPAHAMAIETEWLKSKQISVPGFALLDSNQDGVGEQLPAVPSSSVNLNNQSWALPFDSRSQVGSLRYAFIGQGSLRAGARIGWQRIKTQDRIAFPDGCSTDTNYVYPGICANGDVDIYDFRSHNEKRNTDSVDAYLSNTITTGAVAHRWRLNGLVSRYRERFEPKQAYNFVGTSNIFSPISLPSDASENSLNTNSSVKTNELSFIDSARYANWQFMLGLRYTQLRAASARSDASEAVNYAQNFTTPWLALSYALSQNQVVYGSLGQGIESEFVPNRPDQFRNYGQALPALKSRQWELGWRQKWAGANAALAVFEIRKPFSEDLFFDDGIDTALRIAGGRKATHRGIDMSAALQVSPQLTIDANVSLLKARQKLNSSTTELRTVNVAPVQLRINALYTIAPQWSVLNSVSYRSAKPVTRDNQVQLPAAAQWDALLSWNLGWNASQTDGAQYTARFGISNILNNRYWKDAPTQPWGGIYLFAAEPRAFRLLLSARF